MKESYKIPRLSNAKSIYRNINDKSILRYTTIPYPYRLKHAREWIRRARRNLVKQVGYQFSIFLKNGNEVIGGIGLMHIDRKNQNAEVGYWLARKYWGQGLAKEALRLVLDLGFKRLKMRKIYARVMHPNVRSCKLLESTGFKLEGRFRLHVKDRFAKNKWLDELRYGLLKDEYF
ncbi:MAG: GNAT family N-acetyltransferase [Candidatus Brockarchaeota archaeon]|nr:GNAT family N-acetyltransferase [Candidatus Brockarchaeota archaeon]MBO3808012.1 GNAT family N-acetyltransferase [Candidatus Brockarchaeota archaeon]